MKSASTHYSTIRKEPAHKPTDGYSMSAFYDGLISPVAVLGVLVAFLVLLGENLLLQVQKAAAGDQNAVVHLALFALSLVAGLRAFQSLYFAKRDYAHLEGGFMNVLVFLTFGLFASGTLLQQVADHQVVVGIYFLCSLVGTLNFFSLWAWRIPRGSDYFDYPVERRIQAVNWIVFGIMTLLLGWLLASATEAGLGTDRVLLVVAVSGPLLVFNIEHSSQLTLKPKFLLTNQRDGIENSVATFRRLLGHRYSWAAEEEIVEVMRRRGGDEFRSVRLVRVGREDVAQLSRELIEAFGYIYSYVFAQRDPALLQRLAETLLGSAAGHGILGYMGFYWVVDEKERRVGFVRLDTSHRTWIYRAAESLSLPFALAFALRTPKLLPIGRRAREIDALQQPPVAEELRLTYLVILAEHRRRGYASAVLRLLENACLHSFTNDIRAERITLHVREGNEAARRTFRRAGYQDVEPTVTGKDPLLASGDRGPLRKMEIVYSG